MCTVDLLTILGQLIDGTTPNCLTLVSGLFNVNPVIPYPFCQRFSNVIGDSIFTITQAATVKGAAITAIGDVTCEQVIDTGTVLKNTVLISPTANAYTVTAAGGNLIITLDNSTGVGGNPSWVEVRGFVMRTACL